MRTYARQLSHRDVAHVIEHVLFPHTKNQKVVIKNTRMRAQAVISINYSAVLSCCEREGMWASTRMSDTTPSSLKRSSSSSSVEGQQKHNASPTKPKSSWCETSTKLYQYDCVLTVEASNYT